MFSPPIDFFVCASSLDEVHPLFVRIALARSRWMESLSYSSSPHARSNGSLADNHAAMQQSVQAANAAAEPAILVPPYWLRHQRGDSLLSTRSNRSSNPFIRLVDNTDDASESSKGLWAKSAQIGEHVVIRGTAPGIGDYIVWTCTIDLLNVSPASPRPSPSILSEHTSD